MPPRHAVDCVTKLLPRGSVTALDVGARWGCAGAWWRLGELATVHGFEPDEDECAALNAKASDLERFYPVALGERDGTATLHLSSEEGAASLLPLLHPSDPRISHYPLVAASKDAGSVTVPMNTYQTWANTHGLVRGADVCKLDTQGYELYVLQGMGEHLRDVLAIECEMLFTPMYEQQPMFSDIDEHLRAHGLHLWRLDHLVHYTEVHSPLLRRQSTAVYNNVRTHSPAGGGRLFWGDATYFRDPHTIPMTSQDAGRRLLTLAALFDGAGETDGALASLEHLLSSPSGALGWGSLCIPEEEARREVQASVAALRANLLSTPV